DAAPPEEGCGAFRGRPPPALALAGRQPIGLGKVLPQAIVARRGDCRALESTCRQAVLSSNAKPQPPEVREPRAVRLVARGLLERVLGVGPPPLIEERSAKGREHPAGRRGRVGAL